MGYRLENKEGIKYGKLLILRQFYKKTFPKYRKTIKRELWMECICDCGNRHTCRWISLKSGTTTSCGCWRSEHKFNDISGIKKGSLTITKFSRRKNNIPYWWAKCDCGIEKEINGKAFIMGRIKSCNSNIHRKLVTYDYSHPLYHIWIDIKQRCYNENSSAYFNYGARGVKMCDEWKYSYQSFYDWAISNGWKKGLCIDKDLKGNSLIYSPNTCSILTRTINNQHRRSVKLTNEMANEIRKSPLLLKELAKKYSVSMTTISLIKRNKIWVSLLDMQ